MPISKSVGKNGFNFKHEVRYVQELLNSWRRDQGRPEIATDGLVGPITIAAIEDFQRARTGIVDGRVDPNGRSLKALEAEFEAYTGLIKSLSMLSLVLSYDPACAVPALNDRGLKALRRLDSSRQ